MKWRRGGGRSQYIEDRRGRRVGGRGVKRLGIGGIVIGLVLYYFLGQDVLGLLSPQGGTSNPAQPHQSNPQDEKLVEFISFVLDDLQATWQQTFRSQNKPYNPTTLVLFSDEIRSACGFSTAATGPFYCPADQRIYIDLGFYRELRDNLGAPGDFAQAYVLAHEMAHHIQTLLGISKMVSRQRQANPGRANELSIRQELQADCFAGVWAHSTKRRNLLDPGDVEEGMQTAASIGDDRLQKRSTGRVAPETWTHGSSRQRVTWFRRGLSSGSVSDCDTFSARLQ